MTAMLDYRPRIRRVSSYRAPLRPIAGSTPVGPAPITEPELSADEYNRALAAYVRTAPSIAI